MRAFLCVDGHQCYSKRAIEACPVCDAPTTEVTRPTPLALQQERLFNATR